jgi:hypothetical protein
LNALKYELEDKLYILESLESKAKIQENLLHQIEEQYNEDRHRYETQIQEYITRERLTKREVEEMQEHYESEIATLQRERTASLGPAANISTSTPPPPLPAADATGYDHNLLIKTYIE